MVMKNPVYSALNRAFATFNREKEISDYGFVRIITGNIEKDCFIYYAEREYGVQLGKDTLQVDAFAYTITDKEKFTWFMLQWA